MAWEWVAPVAGSVATVAVGVTGIVATYKAGSRQQATALAAVRQQSDAQVAVAREERQQRRLEAAYSELLVAITEMGYWVHTVYPPLPCPVNPRCRLVPRCRTQRRKRRCGPRTGHLG
jgi:hypothetical protein